MNELCSFVPAANFPAPFLCPSSLRPPTLWNSTAWTSEPLKPISTFYKQSDEAWVPSGFQLLNEKVVVQQARQQVQPSNCKPSSARLTTGCLPKFLSQVGSGNLARMFGFVSVWKRKELLQTLSLSSFKCLSFQKHLRAGDQLITWLSVRLPVPVRNN